MTRRLIEDYIPIKEISAESAREKSIRKGHISTLHLWWARRPLVAARAAVLASLLAAPETYQKRTCLKKLMVDLCQWGAGQETINKAKKKILEAQRDRLNLPADTPLDEVPPPKVLDMFAGGGAIPLEALRLGCETYAVELNPVAHIIELCTLVYPQKHGEKLADEVEKWGNWVIENVRQEIGDLYPQVEIKNSELKIKKPIANSDSVLTPVAYLWTRTVKCPDPNCGADVPLVRQTWLCKKKNRYVALKVIPNKQTKKVEFEVVGASKEEDLGFDPSSGSSRGNSTCRHCGTNVNVKYVKQEGVANRISQQLMAIVCTTPGERGKTYLAGNQCDIYIPNKTDLENRLNLLCEETELTIPDEPLPNYGVLGFRVQPYGLLQWSDLFTPRQLLSLMAFVKYVREAHEKMLCQGYEEDFAKAIATYLGILCDRLADYNSSITHWNGAREVICNTFARQALPMVWDFTETNPIVDGSGTGSSALNWITSVISREAKNSSSGILKRASATAIPIESESLDAVISDPPYFDSVPYADLSDFFYVWFKRSIGDLYPEHFSGKLTPKKKEAIMEPSRHGGDKAKAAKAYEDMMHQAFCEASRVLKPQGMMVVVYAHKTTAGWATLIDSLRRAGFVITEAWPLDTEMGARLRSQNSAALASSIFLVARKRQQKIKKPIFNSEFLICNSEIGDYAMDVKPQLAAIVKERVKTLIEEGVTGADLIIACIGAGLKAYTQFDRVELPNGDELDAQTFLDEVQKTVLDAVLTDVLHCDKKGISAVDKPTQYYILGRYEYGEAAVEFDEANTLARGVGVELDGVGGLTDGKHALVKKTKKSSKVQIQLKNYKDRGESEDLGILKAEKQNTDATPNLIDILHRLLWLAEHKPQDIHTFLTLSQPDASQLRLVAQALAGRALTSNGNGNGSNGNGFRPRTQEQQAIDTLLASWKRLIEENLFTIKN